MTWINEVDNHCRRYYWWWRQDMTDTDWLQHLSTDLTTVMWVAAALSNIVYHNVMLQDDLEAELLESPEREPVSGGKTRRNFGTCHDTGPTPTRPELNLMEWMLWSVQCQASSILFCLFSISFDIIQGCVTQYFMLVSIFIYSNRKYTYCFNVFGISAWTRNVSSLFKQMFLTARRDISFKVFVLKWFCFSHIWDSSLSNSLGK